MNFDLINCDLSRPFIFLSILLIVLLSSNCIAAEFGIGVALQDRTQIIYLPIDMTDNLRTEFSIGYSSFETKSSNSINESETTEIGVGLFHTNETYEKTHLYYGLRLLYIDTNRYMKSTGPFFVATSSEDFNGYKISPTLGFEYFTGDHISIGGEAGFYFQDLEGENQTATNIDRTNTGTNTEIVLRYYF